MKVTIQTHDGFSLAGIFLKPKNSTKVIIFCHGLTANKNNEEIFVRAAENLNKLGLATILFDFRAHGQSSGNATGDFTISGEVTDLKTVVDFCRQKGFNWIGLSGASFGGTIACLYVGKYPNSIKKLFLANPGLNSQKGFHHPTHYWWGKAIVIVDYYLNKFGMKLRLNKFAWGKPLLDDMKKFDPFGSLKKYNGPVMIAHGTKDQIIDYDFVKSCFDKLKNTRKKFVSVDGAIHGFHGEPYQARVVDQIVRFFAS